MTQRIEDYALIGNCRTAALVGRDGSIDWLCFPRFDSGACFAALLGTPEHGRWLLAPASSSASVQRNYRDGSTILETLFTTATGTVRVLDFMPISADRQDLVRVVEGVSGSVQMRMELVVRFDYGSILPWVRRSGKVLLITGGPDTLELFATVELAGEQMKTVSEFTIHAGKQEHFVLNYRASHLPVVKPIAAASALRRTEAYWRRWSKSCQHEGKYRDSVVRSLITLKALIYEPTGGMVAAATTSLPELPGGVRNWDYRFCWLRDATFTLNALLLAGYGDEAAAWQEWLLRAIAGSPDDLQILYSVNGERRLDEVQLPWLPGYENSVPVRIGNLASRQFQLDVYGEVMDSLHLARTADMDSHPHAWPLQLAILKFLAEHWQKPDAGIWEVRGELRHFTHSKMMAWVAFDRAIKDSEQFGLEGPIGEWRNLRTAIHAQICERGFDEKLQAFTQSYGSTHLDASLLLMPQVGFLPADDERIRGTIAAIEKHLLVDGLVMRYSTETNVDALPPGEGAFLPCSFWLADAWLMEGRREEAEALFERLIGLSNDVGLLAEEYDPRASRMLGNFPQSLTHVALLNTARLLSMPLAATRGAAARGDRPAFSSKAPKP
jgi:GH15 family glucan-1,4-alpha-glucosidase